MLTDQVEAQGLKISDLESSLVEHQLKLNATEEMLQQVHGLSSLHNDLQQMLLLEQRQETLTIIRKYGGLLIQHFSPI